jgi:hypothetical protein
MDKYTTAELKAANPLTEKEKIVLSNDAYAQREILETVAEKLKLIEFRLAKVF